LKLELLSLHVLVVLERHPVGVSTYLKLELLSLERDLSRAGGVAVRFHLFEAGAFVTRHAACDLPTR